MASTALRSVEVASKKKALGRLQAITALADCSDDFRFQKILREFLTVLEVTDQQLADALLVSRPTVNRWLRGRNLPHRIMRKPIFDWINNQVSLRLRAPNAKPRRVLAGS